MKQNQYISVRVLEHDNADNIRIGAAYMVNDLEEAANQVVKKYDEKLSWCGGYIANREKYYKRIALVNATTLAVLTSIYQRED